MNRPYVVVRVAATADGRISIGPGITMWDEIADPRTMAMGGTDVWNEVEARVNAIHRPTADILGSNSLAVEGEPLRELPPFEGDREGLYEDFLPGEVVDRPDQEGWMVVVDGRGRLRSGYTGNDRPGWHMMHLVSRGVAPEYLAFLRERKIPYLVAGEERVDLRQALEKMRTLLNITSATTTAGGKLAGALLRAGLVDEVNIIVHPQINGGLETPCLFDSPDLLPGQWPTRLRLLSAQVHADGLLWLRYEVVCGVMEG